MPPVGHFLPCKLKHWWIKCDFKFCLNMLGNFYTILHGLVLSLKLVKTRGIFTKYLGEIQWTQMTLTNPPLNKNTPMKINGHFLNVSAPPWQFYPFVSWPKEVKSPFFCWWLAVICTYSIKEKKNNTKKRFY